MKELTVIDLFCGCGGLSEGFRQLGFKLLVAVDSWKPAVETYKQNHPETEVIHSKIEDLDPKELPKADVIIGGPPCEEFSFAKKGGAGDIKKGLGLVLRYLYFVYVLKPKYWVMENVPRLVNFLPNQIDLSKYGFDAGVIKIPKKMVLNAADFGTPQRRERLISGNYPTPQQTHAPSDRLAKVLRYNLEPWVPMRKIVESLPSPLSRPDRDVLVKDPNYGFTIPAHRLTDHFMNTILDEEEVLMCRKLKENHSWYGKMKFPDDMDAPARTVMATQIRVSRESIILEEKIGDKVAYRTPTLRELACFQGFPITYQFFGKTFAEKAHLIGDAVPVPLSRALAKAILLQEGIKVPTSLAINLEVPLAPEVKMERKEKRYPLTRKFRDHVPGSRIAPFRVDLDNKGDSPSINFLGGRHLKEWCTRLYMGSGKNVCVYKLSWDYLKSKLKFLPARYRKIAEKILNEIDKEWCGKIPDASTLQAIWCEHLRVEDLPEFYRTLASPYRIIEKISNIVEKNLPKEEWYVSVDFPLPDGKRRKIYVKILLISLATSRVCEEINNGNGWVNNVDKKFVFIPSGTS
jgi:DNA (cytosine-5)-methyltransferase 1